MLTRQDYLNEAIKRKLVDPNNILPKKTLGAKPVETTEIPITAQTGIAPIKITRPAGEAYKEKVEEPTVPYRPMTEEKAMEIGGKALTGVLSPLAVPFRGFEAIREKQIGQFTGTPESETRKATAQALLPEIFGTDKRTHADYIDVMEKAGLEPNEMYLPYILTNIAEFVSAPAMMTSGKAFGTGGQKTLTTFEKIDSLKKAFGISDIEAGQWLRSAKMPEKVKVSLAERVKSGLTGMAEGYTKGIAEGMGMGAKAEPVTEALAPEKAYGVTKRFTGEQRLTTAIKKKYNGIIPPKSWTEEEINLFKKNYPYLYNPQSGTPFEKIYNDLSATKILPPDADLKQMLLTKGGISAQIKQIGLPKGVVAEEMAALKNPEKYLSKFMSKQGREEGISNLKEWAKKYNEPLPKTIIGEPTPKPSGVAGEAKLTKGDIGTPEKPVGRNLSNTESPRFYKKDGEWYAAQFEGDEFSLVGSEYQAKNLDAEFRPKPTITPEAEKPLGAKRIDRSTLPTKEGDILTQNVDNMQVGDTFTGGEAVRVAAFQKDEYLLKNPNTPEALKKEVVGEKFYTESGGYKKGNIIVDVRLKTIQEIDAELVKLRQEKTLGEKLGMDTADVNKRISELTSARKQHPDLAKPPKPSVPAEIKTTKPSIPVNWEMASKRRKEFLQKIKDVSIEDEAKRLWELNSKIRKGYGVELSPEEMISYEYKNYTIYDLINKLKKQSNITWGVKGEVLYVDLPKEGQFSFHINLPSDIFADPINPPLGAGDFARYNKQWESLPKYNKEWVGIKRESSHQELRPTPTPKPSAPPPKVAEAPPPVKPPEKVLPSPEPEVPKEPQKLLTRPPVEKITKKPELINEWQKAIDSGDYTRAKELEQGFVNEIKSRRTKPIVTPIPEAPPVEQSAMTRIQKALDDATPLNKEQKAIYHKERQERLAKSMAAARGKVGKEKLYAQLKALEGEMPKVDVSPLKISEADVTELLETIDRNPRLSGYNSINARKAFTKLLEGKLPTPYETELLRQVFPEEFIATLKAKQPVLGKAWNTTLEVLGVPKAIMATLDLSYGLRQGFPMLTRHPKIWAKIFFKDQFKYFASDKYLNALYDDIARNSTRYNMAQDGKLALTDIRGVLDNREEAIMSGRLIEKIPLVGRLIRASNRAYTGFANKLRWDVFNELVNAAEKQGLKVEGKLLDNICEVVNTGTGRGSLPKFLQGSSTLLNQIFFSPRLAISKFNMLLNPYYYAKLEPFARKEALKTLLTMTGTVGTLAVLGRMSGANINLDPRNADFLKAKFGNTRIDLTGGQGQYIRVVAQIASGKLISSTSGKEVVLGEGYKAMTRDDIVSNFLKNKQAPVLTFITGLFSGKDNVGRPFEITKELAQRFIPMVWQDLYDIAKDDPKLIPIELLGFMGAGVQTYSGFNPYGIDNAQVNNVYSNAIYSKWRHSEYNKLIKDGKTAEAQQYLKDNPEIRDYGRLNNAVEFFSAFTKQKDKILKDAKLSAAEKQAKIKEKDQRIIDKAKTVLAAVGPKKGLGKVALTQEDYRREAIRRNLTTQDYLNEAKRRGLIR